jgi:hypothetical protein
MCYGVYISTDSTQDLTSYNTNLLRFEKVVDYESDPCISLLGYASRWYIGDGMITVNEIYRYVSEKVPRATGQEQNPVMKGSVEGSLVLSLTR